MSNYSFKVKAILDGVDIQKQLESLAKSSMVPDVKLKFSGISELADLQKEIVTSGGSVVQTYKALGDTFDSTTKYAKNLETGEMNLVSATNDFASAQKRANQETQQVAKNNQSIEALTIRIEGLTQAQKERINAEKQLADIKNTTNVKDQALAIQGLSKDVAAVTRGMNTFAASIEYTVERFLQIGIIVGTFRLLKNAISSMIDVVTSLNTSLVELQKVTDLEGSSLEEFTQRAYDIGETLARTGQDVIDATTVFSRAGYEIKDALDLADSALLLTNVADGINSVSDASSTLISVLKAFNMGAEESLHIVDALNEVSNNYAIDTDNLADILQRVSGTLGQTGTTMEEVFGLAVGGFTTLRNAEMVASGKYFCQYVQKCA